ncbi:SDR family oxidoreductase [Crocinitomix algicola]|uniref:SDR family oxidoreductase n=1 Tax=Crocinitomix algicola TaxID=1740263 RepID=UPI0008733D6F|nr:SDR family oxidoreductase [Crocinitomix algicola]
MVFITGGTGLLGSHILLELVKRDKVIRALKRPTSSLKQVETVFHYYLGEKAPKLLDKIEWVNGDILDVQSLDNAMDGIETVYHCAALVSFRKKDFKRLMKINKEGTANVVNMALENGVKRFCHVSSTAALGRTSKEFYTESNKWVTAADNSNYAISKYSAENEVWRGKEEGLEVVIINPSVILGIGDWNESSLTIFKEVRKGLKFYTQGMNAFVDARDVAFVFCELDEKNLINERYLTISENIAFKDLFKMIAREFGIKGPTIEAKPWMAQIVWRIEGVLAFLFGKKQNITKETAHSSMSITKYSNDKVRKALGFEFIPIQISIQQIVNYFKSKNL